MLLGKPCCPPQRCTGHCRETVDLMCPDAEHAAMAGGASCEAPTDIWVEKEDSSGAAGLLLGDRSPLSQPCPPCHLMVQNSIVQYCKLLFAPFCPVGSSIAGPSPSHSLSLSGCFRALFFHPFLQSPPPFCYFCWVSQCSLEWWPNCQGTIKPSDFSPSPLVMSALFQNGAAWVQERARGHFNICLGF